MNYVSIVIMRLICWHNLSVSMNLMVSRKYVLQQEINPFSPAADSAKFQSDKLAKISNWVKLY